MYKALDRVNYNNLDLNRDYRKDKVTKTPASLQCLSSVALCYCSEEVVTEAVGVIPKHLAHLLLRTSIQNLQSSAIATIISNWPLSTLCFSEILPECYSNIFEDDMGLDLLVFRGVVRRTKACKMKLLDLRGFKLSDTFTKLVINMWPLLSLKRSQLKAKYLTKLIKDGTGSEFSRLAETVLPKVQNELPKILNDLLNHEMVKSAQFSIHIPSGEEMEVKLDSVKFSTSSTFFIDYLICNCLRSITPITISVSNIYIKSDLSLTEDVMDSLAPFIVFSSQDSKSLDGISLKQLEEGIFFFMSPDLRRFHRLRSLDIQDCNVYLLSGRTRSQTFHRMQLVRLLNSFDCLHRLDISFNYLLGCLGELLEALRHPLEYLSVRGCDLNEHDLECLASSSHSKSLRELNLSKLCQFSIYNMDRISPSYLLKIIPQFTNVAILNLAQNHLPDSSIPDFCKTISTHLKRLVYLDIAGNILNENSLTELIHSVGKVKPFQLFRITCSNNLLEGMPLDAYQVNQLTAGLRRKFMNIWKDMGRTDIHLDIVRLSYAIFVDLLDIFND
ncbi:hypothetical protein FSP39_023791 [Pinctada imbricata]|uniref:Leucine-rich repeat-containing protein 14 n=1 Tax=Pinctada imbricata TaxID=66713 RepID=A0AA89BRU4_PINIB|nr:hypothetical protein FSP39_023791 [Pinctada imbricata]